jgi:hypothetical protein
MSIALVLLILIVLLLMPTAQVLSVTMAVGGWVYPKSARVLRRPAAVYPVRNSVAYSASAADAQTAGIIVLSTSMPPLMV